MALLVLLVTGVTIANRIVVTQLFFCLSHQNPSSATYTIPSYFSIILNKIRDDKKTCQNRYLRELLLMEMGTGMEEKSPFSKWGGGER